MVMTEIEKVKRKLWTYQFKVTDMTNNKFEHEYDLIVEGIYRVAVRKMGQSGSFNQNKVDVLALVGSRQIYFHKFPYLVDGHLKSEMVHTSPINIFIKNAKPNNTKPNNTNRVTKRKSIRTK